MVAIYSDETKASDIFLRYHYCSLI